MKWQTDRWIDRDRQIDGMADRETYGEKEWQTDG